MPQEMIEKIPPQSVEAEMAVLGSMLLDRDAMIMGLSGATAGATVRAVMRPVQPLFLEEALVDAYLRMRQRGARAEVVLDAAGHVAGVLTNENIAEMMMVENARPGWQFKRR